MKIADYLAHLQARNLSPHTLKAYRSDLMAFKVFLRARKLRVSQVNPKVIDEFIQHLRTLANRRTKQAGRQGSSIARCLAVLSAYFDYRRLRSNGKLTNPVLLVRRPRLPRRSPQPIDEPDLGTLLHGIDSLRDRALFSLFLSSGLRLSELQQLDRGSIRIEEEVKEDETKLTVGFGSVTGKGGKQRMFLVDLATVKLVAQYLASRGSDGVEALFVSQRRKRLSRRAIQERLTTWCRRLGLTAYHAHQLRHSFGTRLLNAGVPLMVLRDLMGHASLSTTIGYAKIENETMLREYFAAMEMLAEGGPGEETP